jgi:malonyl CoA-acyl carrier protein transacylase
MNVAFVFPGQGSQFVGMGQELAEAFPVARQVFQEIDEALVIGAEKATIVAKEVLLRVRGKIGF